MPWRLTSTEKYFEPSLNLHVQLPAFPASRNIGSLAKCIYEDIFIPLAETDGFSHIFSQIYFATV
jgi:hypothetical protein